MPGTSDKADERPPFDKQQVLDRINESLETGTVPHNRALGLRAVDCAVGEATLELPYDERLVGNPDTGVLHGGAITSLVDATCGMAVFLELGTPRRIATLDLRIDYLKPAAPPHAVRATATCYKVTRQVAFVRAIAFHDDPGDPIASAAGTFMIFDSEPSSQVAERSEQARDG